MQRAWDQKKRKTDPEWAKQRIQATIEWVRHKRATDPEYRKAWNLRHGLRKHAATLAELQGGWHCAVEWPDEGVCGVKLNPLGLDPENELDATPTEAGEYWEVDHKIPASRPDVYYAKTGRKDINEITNLQLTCIPCNRRKSDRLLPAYVPAEIIELMADPDNDDKPQDFDQPPLFDQGTEL